MKPQILIRRDLENIRCDVPGCTHVNHPDGLPFHAVCHPSSLLQLWYADGVMTVKCGSCRTIVCRIAVGVIHLDGPVH